jgi:hypothetical protein
MPQRNTELYSNERSLMQSTVPRVIIALGCYGSGLTPLTGVLRLLGVDLPTDGGSSALAKIYDDIGYAGCIGWNDYHAVAKALQSASATQHLKERALDALGINFAASKLFVLHDPRICRSLPFWRAVVAAFGARALAVLMVRHPLDVMASLRRHYGCAALTSYLIWLRYMLDAENASRDLPRAIVTYDGMLTDWSSTISSLQTGLGVRWPRQSPAVDLEIEHFLEEPTRRHEADQTEFAIEAKDWLLEAYDALAQLSSDPQRTESHVRLDRIRSELNRAFAIFRPSLFDAEVEFSNWRNRGRHDGEHIENTNEEVQRLYSELKGSGLFDWHGYLQAYPDVRDSGSDPLLHYLQYGASEARDPNPLFDTDWYLDNNPDVKEVNLNPLWHYLRHGAAEGRDPSALFDTEWYIQEYPDVSAMALNPLVHYLIYGRAQGRRPKPPV